MKVYSSSEEFISEIKSHIKWKRAKEIATIDIKNHIEDQYEINMLNGFNKEDAMIKAIESMGDATKIGQELNLAYKPKTNWSLILLTTLLTFFGVIIEIFLFDDFSLNNISALIIGSIICVGIYFLDYTYLMRNTYLFCLAIVIITLLTFLFDIRNGLSTLGYSYSFYILLVYPILWIGLIFKLTYIKNEYILPIFTLSFLVPLIIAVIISSVTAIAILVLTALIVIVYCLKENCYTVNKNTISLTAIILVIFLILFLFVTDAFDIRLTNILSQKFNYYVFKSTINQSSFLGSSNSDLLGEEYSVYLADYPIAKISLQYGYCVSLSIFLLFSVVLFLATLVFKKQKTSIGKMLALITLVILEYQIVESFLSNFALIGFSGNSLPFVSSGGLFTIYNFALIGLLLSITRNETIIKDWIKFKEK